MVLLHFPTLSSPAHSSLSHLINHHASLLIKFCKILDSIDLSVAACPWHGIQLPETSRCDKTMLSYKVLNVITDKSTLLTAVPTGNRFLQSLSIVESRSHHHFPSNRAGFSFLIAGLPNYPPISKSPLLKI